jgi:arylsulfatase A-like enzyme
VPLIFHFPGRFEPRVDPEPVELIHLTPTLLELAGAPLEEGRWMQGQSLLSRLMSGSPGAEQPVYAFSEAGYHTNRNWQKIVQDQRFKLVLARSGAAQRWLAGPGEPTALYDLESDPEETVSVTGKHPQEAQRLRTKLDEHWDQPPFEARVQEGVEGEEREMDEETRKQLKALGYLD